MSPYAESHKRFWRQVILWLAFRDSLTNSNVWINLAQRRYQPKTPVRFTIGAKDAAGMVINDAKFEVFLTSPAGQRTKVEPTSGADGTASVQLERESVAAAGLYRIDVIAKQSSQTLGSSQAEFVVFDQDKEKSVATAAPDQMRRLAGQTERWGGRLVPPNELAGLLDEILDNPPIMKVEIPQKWKVGDTVLDGSIFLLLFVAFLAAEWTCRKKWGLV